MEVPSGMLCVPGEAIRDRRFDGKRPFGKALHYGPDVIHFPAFGD